MKKNNRLNIGREEKGKCIKHLLEHGGKKTKLIQEGLNHAQGVRRGIRYMLPKKKHAPLAEYGTLHTKLAGYPVKWNIQAIIKKEALPNG